MATVTPVYRERAITRKERDGFQLYLTEGEAAALRTILLWVGGGVNSLNTVTDGIRRALVDQGARLIVCAVHGPPVKWADNSAAKLEKTLRDAKLEQEGF